MNLQLSAKEYAFRAEVRAFINEKLTPDLQHAGANCTGIYCDYPAANAWHRALAARGWSVPTWPSEYGGQGWTPVERYIFDTEMAAAGAPSITPNSTRFVAPAIMAFGTEAQKAEHLPGIRSGDDWWAQGYSEPGAGSDLASLRCSAVRDGDHYVVNGSKIWTTHAHFSNRIFCLVRTKREDKPQKGISFLLFDMSLAGIEVRPIISMSGEHELNEVFFSEVRVPATGLLGLENEGWTVAKYLLQHERSTTWSPLMRARFDRLCKQAAQRPSDDGTALIDNDSFSSLLADLDIRVSMLEATELRMLADAAADRPISSIVSSMIKVQGSEIRQALTELALAIHGRSALMLREPALVEEGLLLWAPDAMAMYLNDRAASIYGGSNEVQRNIIAKELLS